MIINEKTTAKAAIAIPINSKVLEVTIDNHHYRGVTYGDADRVCDTYNRMRIKSPGKAINWLKNNVKGQLKNIDDKFNDGEDSHDN